MKSEASASNPARFTADEVQYLASISRTRDALRARRANAESE